jgi:hypothetical protein
MPHNFAAGGLLRSKWVTIINVVKNLITISLSRRTLLHVVGLDMEDSWPQYLLGRNKNPTRN